MKRTRYTITIIGIILHFHTVAFTQNVGIGNPSPSEKLDVAGNVKADTVKSNALRIAPNAGTGKVLTSDAMGNGNWEALTLDSNEGSGNVGYGMWGDCQTNGTISGYQPVADTAASSNALFGTSVACHGDYAVVGATQDDLTFTNQGSASIYHFNGTSWDFIQKISDPNPSANASFGSSVAISDNFIFVGAVEDDISYSDQGSVCVFQLNGTSWEFLEKLTDPDGQASDYYGRVAIDGEWAIIGARRDDINVIDQGSALIYHFNGVNWDLQLKIYDLSGGEGDNFGASVAMNENKAIVGAPLDDETFSNQGSVSVYQYDGVNWVFQQKLLDPSPNTSDYLGTSVAISGNEIFSGAYLDDDVGNSAGSVLMFGYSGSTWLYRGKIYNPEVEESALFGISLSLSEGIALIGSSHDYEFNNGSATIFQKVGMHYQKLQHIVDPGGFRENLMGEAVCIDSESRHFIIGVPNYGNASGKALFGRIR